jgi:hypothetical protein
MWNGLQSYKKQGSLERKTAAFGPVSGHHGTPINWPESVPETIINIAGNHPD